MKRIALSLSCLAMLAGCATSQVPSAAASGTVTDHERVAAIERAAASLGVRVIWIRLPQKNAAATGS